MSVQDLSCWHDRRTVDNAHGRSGYLSFQQFDRATDRAEAPASVTDGAAIPSARQLGSSTDSRSEPDFLTPRKWLARNIPVGLGNGIYAGFVAYGIIAAFPRSPI